MRSTFDASVRGRRAIGTAAVCAAALALVPLPAGAHHLAPQTIETTDPAIYVETPSSVGTETACPGAGWSGGSALYLANATAHIAWDFTVPADHTGVVEVVGYRDGLDRPFYFWVDAAPMALQPGAAGAQECRSTLATSAALGAGTHRVNVSGTNDRPDAYLDYFRLVTTSISGDLVVTKVSDMPGTFDFTVNCGAAVTDRAVSITVAAAGPPATAGAPITGIPVGTSCTVAETRAPGFAARPSQQVVIAGGTNTVAFTNVRERGALVVSNSATGGTGIFSYTVDCTGTAFDSTFSLAANSSRRVEGIPTGTTCAASQAPDAAFATVATPADGTVTVATGDNPVTFANTARAVAPQAPSSPDGPLPAGPPPGGRAPGYWLVGSDGGIFAFDAPFAGSTGALRLNRPIVAMKANPSGAGYWLVASDGGIFAFDAPYLGSTGALRLNQPIVGMAPTPTGRGYWLVAADGGIFAFGDAGFHGSTGALRLARPIVAMAPTPTGRGYWLVASDGGIFAFGDAAFRGSTGGVALRRPVVGMASSPTGGGYWLVASDGGIFGFGDAAFLGSTGAMPLRSPVVAMAPTPTGRGYWLVASDGGIFAFGDAAFRGSTGALRLNRPVVGMAPAGG